MFEAHQPVAFNELKSGEYYWAKWKLTPTNPDTEWVLIRLYDHLHGVDIFGCIEIIASDESFRIDEFDLLSFRTTGLKPPSEE